MNFILNVQKFYFTLQFGFLLIFTLFISNIWWYRIQNYVAENMYWYLIEAKTETPRYNYSQNTLNLNRVGKTHSVEAKLMLIEISMFQLTFNWLLSYLPCFSWWFTCVTDVLTCFGILNKKKVFLYSSLFYDSITTNSATTCFIFFQFHLNTFLYEYM